MFTSVLHQNTETRHFFMENSCSVHKEHPHSEDFCLPVQGLGCVEFTTRNGVGGVATAKFTTPYDKCSQNAKSR